MKKEEIKKHLRRVINRLERVLYEMKSVVIELKDVVQQIDIMTKQIATDYGLNLNEIDQQFKNRRAHGLWKLMQKYGLCRESENIICKIPAHLNISELLTSDKDLTFEPKEKEEVASEKIKKNGMKDFSSCIWSDKMDLEKDMSINKEKMDFDMDTLKLFQLHSAFSYEEKLEYILENCESFCSNYSNVTSDFYKADYNRELNSWQAYPLVLIDDTWDV